jgi:hypothetical protein
MSTSRALLFYFVTSIILVWPLAASAQMSESERKSAARAAFTEGIALQDSGRAADALAKFETAQKLFDAPTHQLHIAECLSLTGKLLESAETYEALIHRNLGSNPPEAFTQAQEQAKAELPGVRARIPNLRITVKPDPSTLQNLQVTVNGTVMPNDLLGIARPVNPGQLRINAAANNYRLRTPVEIPLGERDPKNDPRIVDLVLEPAQGAGPPPVVIPPPPPPYTGGNQPPPPVDNRDKDKDKDKEKEGSSSTGILVGPRLGILIPGGGFSGSGSNASSKGGDTVNFDQVAGTGGGIGVDIMARFARLLLVGGTLEYISLSSPSDLQKQLDSNVTGQTKQSSFYIGVNLGIVPNIDKVSFYGELGVGLRTLSRSVDISSANFNGTLNETFSGVDGKLGAGLMIPAGKIRIVPEAALSVGAFSNANSQCAGTVFANIYGPCFKDGSISSTATHTLFWIGIGIYFHADLGAKKTAAGTQ